MIFVILVEIYQTMKKLFLLSILCFVFEFGFSQVQNSAAVTPNSDLDINDPKLVEFKRRNNELRKNSIASTEAYLGFDEKLKAILIGSVIPAVVPTAKAGTTKSEYVKILNEWISKNPQSLKPENKNSLITE